MGRKPNVAKKKEELMEELKKLEQQEEEERIRKETELKQKEEEALQKKELLTDNITAVKDYDKILKGILIVSLLNTVLIIAWIILLFAI